MPADLTFDITALDKATKTFVAMSQQVEKLARRLDRLDRKDVDVDVKVDTKPAIRAAGGLTSTMSSGATAVSKNWILAVGAITAGLMTLPTVGTIAAGGIVAAIGSGLAAIPIIFAAQNKQVKQAWASTIKDMKKEVKGLSEPFVPVLVNISRMVRSAFDELSPTLERVFEGLAPHVESFADDAIEALTRIGPALEPMADAFGRLLDSLGPRLPGIVEGLADALTDLAETVSENPDLFARMIEGALRLVEFSVRLVDLLAEIQERISRLTGTENPWINLLANTNPIIIALTTISELFELLREKIGLGLPAVNLDVSGVIRGFGRAIGIGEVWDSKIFTGLFSASIGGVVRGLARSMDRGGFWGSRIFTAAFNVVIGGVIRGFGRAMSRGFSWGRRVFSAAFRASVSGVFAALRSAVSAGANWAGRVFTATFNVRRIISTVIPGLPGRQHGGPVQAGRAFIVGEKRPEIFVPNTSGRIIPRVPTTARPASGGDEHMVLEIRSGGSRMDDLLVEVLRRSIRTRGGDVQVVLGGRT